MDALSVTTIDGPVTGTRTDVALVGQLTLRLVRLPWLGRRLPEVPQSVRNFWLLGVSWWRQEHHHRSVFFLLVFVHISAVRRRYCIQWLKQQWSHAWDDVKRISILISVSPSPLPSTSSSHSHLIILRPISVLSLDTSLLPRAAF